MEREPEQTETRPIVCHDCGQTFSTEEELSAHLIEAHGDPGEEI